LDDDGKPLRPPPAPPPHRGRRGRARGRDEEDLVPVAGDVEELLALRLRGATPEPPATTSLLTGGTRPRGHAADVAVHGVLLVGAAEGGLLQTRRGRGGGRGGTVTPPPAVVVVVDSADTVIMMTTTAPPPHLQEVDVSAQARLLADDVDGVADLHPKGPHQQPVGVIGREGHVVGLAAATPERQHARAVQDGLHSLQRQPNKGANEAGQERCRW